MAEPNRRSIGVVDVDFGIDVTVVEPVNLYGCSIGDRCFIGPFVEIQRNVRLGSDCRIQSHSFICEMVTMGDGCSVAHGVMFINDRYRKGGPARGDRDRWEATEIGDRVSIGSNATILPVRICSDVVIGAGSVVSRDIDQPGTYVGSPARRLEDDR